MTRKRYTVYNTELRKYLHSATLPDGDPRSMLSTWTSRPEKALRFPGIKSARGMVAKLGNYGEYVVKNDRGEIIA